MNNKKLPYVASTHVEVFNHTVNFSVSKQQYRFPRDKRFRAYREPM